MSSTEKADADPRPACSVHKQCSENDYRDIDASAVKPTFEPCGNPECFDGDEPADDTTVVVSRGVGSKKMHKKRGIRP